MSSLTGPKSTFFCTDENHPTFGLLRKKIKPSHFSLIRTLTHVVLRFIFRLSGIRILFRNFGYIDQYFFKIIFLSWLPFVLLAFQKFRHSLGSEVGMNYHACSCFNNLNWKGRFFGCIRETEFCRSRCYITYLVM